MNVCMFVCVHSSMCVKREKGREREGEGRKTGCYIRRFVKYSKKLKNSLRVNMRCFSMFFHHHKQGLVSHRCHLLLPRTVICLGALLALVLSAILFIMPSEIRFRYLGYVSLLAFQRCQLLQFCEPFSSSDPNQSLRSTFNLKVPIYCHRFAVCRKLSCDVHALHQNNTNCFSSLPRTHSSLILLERF